MTDKKVTALTGARELVSQFRWWELMLAVSVFLLLFFRSLANVPSLEDEGVYSADDIVVSWYCTGGGKNEFQNMVGASGRNYRMGGARDTCSKSQGEEFYVGRRLVAYYKDGRESPIQIDFEGGGGYKAGIQGADIFAALAIYGFPIFMLLLIVAKKRRGDYEKNR
ncbi:hypothetical protein ACMG4M_05540 [Alcanivorax sp. IL3]|uniref:hypothetical protein n=1 Tax=unclassified Alcanivorax TaxID=2638842 RepID=UPI0039C205A4